MEIVSYAPIGFHGQLVSVEVDLRTGIPGTDIIGLPASEVREAKERVRVALRNSGFEYPSRRVLINLAPADVPKSGNGFDLAIALAVIIQSEQLESPPFDRILAVGELRLDGSVAKVRGGIAAVDEASKAGIRRFLVPIGNYREAAAIGAGRVGAVKHLAQLGRLLVGLAAEGSRIPSPVPDRCTPAEPGTIEGARVTTGSLGDYAHMRGNALYKRALTIAAAGNHNLLVVGPPGVGKSMGILLLPGILAPLSREEALEVTRMHSLVGAGAGHAGLIRVPPFRAPHHNSSVEGLLGGGRSMLPGEVSLAHRGVLFLDEVLEFTRPALQGLREPLERKYVQISRAGRIYRYPAAFQLFMAANPCPCGNLGRRDRDCLCSLAEVERYWRRIGGPLLDRVDLRVPLVSVELDSMPPGEGTAELRAQVHTARQRQQIRARIGLSPKNSEIPVGRLFTDIQMTPGARHAFRTACTRLRLSARASVSVARVSRTVADLDNEDKVHECHVLEAVAHRRNGEDQPLWRVG